VNPSDEQTVEPHLAFITLWANVVVPTTRMVCVWAMRDDDEELQADVSAVVALETSRELCYSAAGKKPAGEAPDHAGMIALGWSYDGERIYREAQIVDPENGCTITPAGLAFARPGAHYKLVVADWPRAQDDERLQDTLEDVRRLASADGPGDDDDGDGGDR
jgi:hypothetical protein